MDRRTLIAVFALIGVYYAYFFVLRPMIYPEPEVAQVDTDAALTGGDGSADVGEDPDTDVPDPTAPDEAGAEAPAPAPSTVPERTVSFMACTAEAQVVSHGGALRDVEMSDWEGPYEVTAIYSYVWGLVSGGESTWSPYGGDPGRKVIATDEARYLVMGSGDLGSNPADVLVQESGDELVLRGTTADGIEVTRRLKTSSTDPCVVKVEASWHNPTGQDFDGKLWLGMHDRLADEAGYYSHVFKPYWEVDGSWNSYTYPKTGGYMGLYSALEEPAAQDGRVDWFGMSDGYFSFVVVPRGGDNAGTLVVSPVDVGTEEPLYGHHYTLSGLAAGATVAQTFDVYVGPNRKDTLIDVHPDLYYLVDLGWFAFFGRPLLWLLELYYSFVGNWGLSIILLTLTVKLLFFPLTQMAYASSQRMSALQPQLKEIREKFADNQEELNRQTMALFRENKVNPVGGCLPMVIQMPIWISLYRVLLNSVDLYHTEFLYLRDLSVADPYAILPLIVVGMMFAQQQLMPTGNMDPNQARIMKFMPLVFGFLFFSFPSGLVLYIFVNMLLTILQQWFIKRRFKTATPAAA